MKHEFENQTWILSSRGYIFSMKNKETPLSKPTKNTIVIGILSRSKNLCLRAAQREMFIPKASAYKPLTIKVFFLIDQITPELEEEHRIYQDLVFLNTTVNGHGQNYAKKFHIWLNYAVSNFPDAVLIGRMDDDVFACVPQIFDRLNDVKHDLLYYGYPTGLVWQCPTQNCVDEMFLIVGVELARRVANRSFCDVNKEENCLYDGNAGHRFGHWIKIYNDIVYVNERANGQMVWFWRGTPNKTEYEKYKTFDFCGHYLLYHKATVTDIYKMNRNNSLLLNDNFLTNTTEETMNKAIAAC